ncbi:MAG TPA: SgcJ/EcaC family oxidoreductase [Lacipirellulaceae bacterium]|nr:SgcJ/EcaC family oxidoreductase [Lacipirellulaceae bacterium]
MRQSLVVCSALILASNVPSLLYAAPSTSAEDAIRRSAQEFVEAYDHGNAEAVAAEWAPDGDYIIGQQTIKGREAIAKLYTEFFRANPGSKMTVKIDSIRVLAPTVAIEQGTASVEGSANGPPSASAYSAVHVKQGDKWLMASVREEEVPSISANTDLSDLAWLIGQWAADGDAGKADINFEWMANKHFLRGEVSVKAKKEGAPAGGVQIIGKNPQTGRIVSWFFSADGGHGYGEWFKDGTRWMINTQGMSADGAPTTATNVVYRADDNVMSWQSINRAIGEMKLPDQREVVIERVGSGK